jgi:hypothetical protein
MARSARWTLVAMLGLGPWLCFPAPAAAQAGDATVARNLGREGIELFEKERWEEALEKLTRAEAMFHAPTLLLYIARTRSNLGQLTAARADYQALIDEELPPDAPLQFRNAKDAAYKELLALEKRIPSLLIIVEPGASVSLNGRPVDVSSPILLDPGEHTVESGEVRRRVTLAEGDGVVRLQLDAAPDDPPPDADPPEPAPHSTDGPIWPGATVLGVGGLGLGLGLVTGLMAMSKTEDIKSRCIDDVHCLTSDAGLGNDAETLATISTVGFVVGGVLAATGIVLLVWRPGGETDDSVALRAGPGGAWISGVF